MERGQSQERRRVEVWKSHWDKSDEQQHKKIEKQFRSLTGIEKAPSNTISLHKIEKLVFLSEGFAAMFLLFMDSSGLCSLLHKVQIP